MLAAEDEVFLYEDSGRVHAGRVLGLYKKYFWFYISEKETVFQSNLINIEERGGRRFVYLYDKSKKLAEFFDAEGRFKSDFFQAAEDPTDMINKVKMWKLLLI